MFFSVSLTFCQKEELNEAIETCKVITDISISKDAIYTITYDDDTIEVTTDIWNKKVGSIVCN